MIKIMKRKVNICFNFAESTVILNSYVKKRIYNMNDDADNDAAGDLPDDYSDDYNDNDGEIEREEDVERREAGRREESSEEEPVGRAAVILLVEDDEAHATHIMRVLEEERVANRIYWVKDGAEALDFLYHRGRYAEVPRPDLVLLDLRLPRVNGHEVLLEIKRSEDLQVIPVVVLTTSEREADIMSTYISYANSYIVKPIDFEKLRRVIAHIKFWWLIWNRHPWQMETESLR